MIELASEDLTCIRALKFFTEVFYRQIFPQLPAEPFLAGRVIRGEFAFQTTKSGDRLSIKVSEVSDYLRDQCQASLPLLEIVHEYLQAYQVPSQMRESEGVLSLSLADRKLATQLLDRLAAASGIPESHLLPKRLKFFTEADLRFAFPEKFHESGSFLSFGVSQRYFFKMTSETGRVDVNLAEVEDYLREHFEVSISISEILKQIIPDVTVENSTLCLLKEDIQSVADLLKQAAIDHFVSEDAASCSTSTLADLAVTVKKFLRSRGAAEEESNSPYRNPYAVQAKALFESDDPIVTRAYHQTRETAKLSILSEHLSILKTYFQERREQGDLLAQKYQTLNFKDFILRLFHKRFKTVYLDGRMVVLRDGSYHSNPKDEGVRGRQFLDSISQRADLLEDYLCLEETMLSPLVLPEVVSVILGTGNRSNSWDPRAELASSIDLAWISYPAAAELRSGKTAHYDLLCITKPIGAYSDEQGKRLEYLQSNLALLNAARAIYGRLAFEDENPEHFVQIEEYWLHREAYQHRAQANLLQVLTAADRCIGQYGLGGTFHLKGLGLGAFGFFYSSSNRILETLFIESLHEILKSPEGQFQHIKRIHLINLPTLFAQGKKEDEEYQVGANPIVLQQMCCHPTEKQKDCTIGATVICGDSASLVGNEGNLGSDRSSSDDPAAQYSLLDPCILDPSVNLHLANIECIQILPPLPKQRTSALGVLAGGVGADTSGGSASGRLKF